jgi:hypothetical protein
MLDPESTLNLLSLLGFRRHPGYPASATLTDPRPGGRVSPGQ